MNLRKIFDDVTRDDPQACEISFSECESTMFRARKTLEPKIPQTALEFSDMITTTNFGKYYKFSVSVGNEIGVVFISEPMKDFVSQITNIQYDGTFFTVPIQFYQLWTIFISVGRTNGYIKLYWKPSQRIFLIFDLRPQCQIGKTPLEMRLEKLIPR